MHELLQDEQDMHLRVGAEPASPAERQASIRDNEQCLRRATEEAGLGPGAKSATVGGGIVPVYALDRATAPFATLHAGDDLCACNDSNSAAHVRQYSRTVCLLAP